jgi:transcription-repair coupling factor (superfamily II helicase)
MGRVGRSNKKAFCYLVVPSFEGLTKDARTRLDAIEQFSDLGSGFSIAMRDLDIRGAGDLLGGEQSGFINDMGIDTYHKILNEAIEELKEEIGGPALMSMGISVGAENPVGAENFQPVHKKFVKDCQVETDAEALIPDDYVQSQEERLRLYRELNEAKDVDETTRFEAELVDRFGKLPHSVQELTNVVRLRLLASELGIERIVFKNKIFHCFFISQSDSPFYQSPVFINIVEYIKKYPSICKVNEGKDKLSLSVSHVKNVNEALKILRQMRGELN